MGLRGWLLLAVILGLAGWWYSPMSPRTRPAPVITAVPSGAGTPLPPCPLPPRVTPGAMPLQSPVPDAFPALRIEQARLQPLAGFSVDARVLSRRDYRLGREAAYSPTDLALGWERMADPAVVARLDIDQSGRWYRYRWGAGSPPIPSREIALSSANMHIVPADAATAAALQRVRAGQRVRIDGWLVQMDAPDGWSWRSSLTREDQGAGACEVIYTCAITPL